MTTSIAADKQANKQDVHNAIHGPHKPKFGHHDNTAERLESLVESTRSSHEAHVGMSDLGGVADVQGKRLDRLSHYFKSLGCNLVPNTKEFEQDLVSWKMGNYVALRNGKTGDQIFEDMPLYVRIGMHLLFYSSTKASLLRYSSVEALLKRMSEREGEIYDDASNPDEVQDFIHNFIKTYSIDTKDLQETDLTKYPTRNSFFYRKLNLDVRPIAEPNNTRIVTSAADCRLMVFNNAKDAKDIWIKGKQFSVADLINPDAKSENDHNKGDKQKIAAALLSEDSAIAIFRLAPGDYHRYHHPVGPVRVAGSRRCGHLYYTVNPDCVNEDFNVFTGNVRDIRYVNWTPVEGGETMPVAFASIGALLVGSINLTNADHDKTYTRGQEMGYFAYGGSTCIAVFSAKAKIKWDDDLKANSAKGIETLVKVNERVGISEA